MDCIKRGLYKFIINIALTDSVQSNLPGNSNAYQRSIWIVLREEIFN